MPSGASFSVRWAIFLVIGSGALELACQCEGKSAGTAASKANKDRSASKAAPPAKREPTEATPEPDGPAPTPAADGSAAAPETKEGEPDRGIRFADPPWYRKNLFPEATVANSHRSPADPSGRFASTILFDLPATMTKDDCVARLQEKVGSSVGELTQEVQADGRVELTATTERFEVKMQCGDVKGTLKAYVSYRWTS